MRSASIAGMASGQPSQRPPTSRTTAEPPKAGRRRWYSASRPGVEGTRRPVPLGQHLSQLALDGGLHLGERDGGHPGLALELLPLGGRCRRAPRASVPARPSPRAPGPPARRPGGATTRPRPGGPAAPGPRSPGPNRGWRRPRRPGSAGRRRRPPGVAGAARARAGGRPRPQPGRRVRRSSPAPQPAGPVQAAWTAGGGAPRPGCRRPGRRAGRPPPGRGDRAWRPGYDSRREPPGGAQARSRRGRRTPLDAAAGPLGRSASPPGIQAGTRPVRRPQRAADTPRWAPAPSGKVTATSRSSDGRPPTGVRGRTDTAAWGFEA